MSTSAKTVYLVSGANRGIGLGIVTQLAARPSAVVYAGARVPEKADDLNALASEHANVHVVSLVSGDECNNEAAVGEIERREHRLDVVIANAGTSKYFGPFMTTPVSEVRDHFEVNTVGVVVLAKAAVPLLLRDPTSSPKFVVIGSAAASLTQYLDIKSSAYSISKAAAHYVSLALHNELGKDGLVSFSVSPGWVQTDSGNLGATSNGLEKAPVTVDASAAGIINTIDGATLESGGGKLLDFEAGKVNPW